MQILVAGNCRNLERVEIIRAIKFYGKELIDPARLYPVKVYVDLCGRSQDPGNAGGIVLPSYEKPVELLHIKLRTSQSRIDQLITLAHEMVHGWQIVTGRFRSSRDRYGRLYVVWNKTKQKNSLLNGEESPWEKEANEMELPLFERYNTMFP